MTDICVADDVSTDDRYL